MFKTIRILFAVAATLLAPVAATAQPDPAMLPQMCLQLCYTSQKMCDGGLKADDPACVTRRVACASTCQPCLVGRPACTKDGGDMKTCLNDYGHCIRESTDKAAEGRAPIFYKGGDGGAKDKAVLISGAAGEIEGVTAEGIWAALKHPDWKKKAQKVVREDGRVFDVIDYEAKDGPKQAWFDITEFFGKMEGAPAEKK